MKNTLLLMGLAGWLASCQQLQSAAPETEETHNMSISTAIDWQGHRGARGLLPENTIPAFLLALEYPQVKTLELDVVITEDQQVVVSHEPWMSADICSHPDGMPVDSFEAETLNIYQMPLASVQEFDCGQRGNPRFPTQQPQAAFKPTLAAVIAAAEARAKTLEREPPYYNVEIKSQPEWDGVFTPPPSAFASLVVELIATSGVEARTTIQSFDPRSLRAVRALKPTWNLALLVANPHSVAENLAILGFLPKVYSPYFMLCSEAMLDTLHDKGIQLIPWTVNEISDMRQLLELGVDGIITDYPDRIADL
jgi:glycerophosphoryl diester phosphodiesterase